MCCPPKACGCYLDRAAHIDIVCVLHGARDIPVLLRDVT